MSWIDEAALPFTPDGRIYFSPEFSGLIYIIDQGNTNFYKYNTATDTYTQLTAPTYHVNVAGSFIRPLALSPDSTKLACISDGVANHRGGRRIEIYTIADDSWAASSQVQNMDNEVSISQGTVLSGLVWADEDTIWVWASEATTYPKIYARCIKYTISNDTFTIYSTLLNGGLNYAQAYGAAINSAGTIIYGSYIGTSVRGWYKYTIATDTYASGTSLTSGRIFAVTADSDKLWYVTTADYRQGYIDIADDSENDNQFTENTDRDTGYGLYFAVRDNLSFIVAHASAAAPELMSEGVVSPTVTTDPASAVGQTTATLNGALDDDGGETCTCGFEWGETVAYGNTTPTQSRTIGQTFAQTITGLTPGKTYHFRAFASSTAGTSYGSDETFTTSVAPAVVITDPASAVGQTSATLNGTLDDDGGESCDCGFEYGETTDYGTETPTESKTSGQTFSQEILGLKGGTVYHFRAKATNSAGTSYGTDRTFHTEALSAEAHQALGRGYALGRHGL